MHSEQKQCSRQPIRFLFSELCFLHFTEKSQCELPNNINRYSRCSREHDGKRSGECGGNSSGKRSGKRSGKCIFSYINFVIRFLKCKKLFCQSQERWNHFIFIYYTNEIRLIARNNRYEFNEFFYSWESLTFHGNVFDYIV